MLLPAIACFLITWLSLRFLLGWWNGIGKAKRRYPPSLPSLPLIGSLPFLRGSNNFADFFMRKANQLGPIFTFRTGNKLVLTLNSREVIEDALLKHSSSFSGRKAFYTENIANPNKKGLAMRNTDKEWKKYHQHSLTILKHFGFGVKSILESRILMEVEFMTDYVLKQNGNSFNPRELVYLSTNNILMNIIFGRRQDYNLGLTEFGYQIKRIFNSADADLEVSALLRFLPVHRNMLRQHIEGHAMLDKIYRIELDESLKEGADDNFVRRYIESVGKDYDPEQLKYTVRDIVGAGSDTTVNAILWSLIALANNPDIQDRLRAETDSVVPRDRLPSMSDQLNIPFVEATILEVLRWKTLVPLSLPHMTLSDTNVGDYFVPVGTTVLVNLYGAHMNPKIWQDPEEFQPTRFLDEDGQVIRRECVIPFSLGRRSCFGEVLAREQLFLVLTGLVQRFIIRPPEGQSIIDEKPTEPTMAILTSSEFDIRLIARH